MSIESQKDIVLRYFLESHNDPYNLDVMDELCSAAYAQEHKRWQRMEHTAFPDKHFTIEDWLLNTTESSFAGPSAECT